MNKEKAKELLDEWKERLGLQEWTINLKINVPHSVMGNLDGETRFDVVMKCAKIKIVGEYYDEECWLKYNFERILVHELLHLKLGVLDIYEDNLQYEETVVEHKVHQLIEDMAQALVMAKYGKNGRQNNSTMEEIIDDEFNSTK